MTDPRTVSLTDAQLRNLEQAARASFGEDERSQVMINGTLSLITEVRKLRRLAAQVRDAQGTDLAAIEARLAAATEELPFSHEAWQILHGRAPADLRALVAEVKRLRAEDAVWEKHGLVQIVMERDRLRSEVARLQSLLETEQHAKWAVEQDLQHLAERLEKAIK